MAESENPEYAIDSGWLVEVVNEHTCGTGRDGYYGAHEPGCGLIPVARVDDLLMAQAAVDRIRRRHPRGDEESGFLAPGLWCPTCGHERADNGYGACPDRAALTTAAAQPTEEPTGTGAGE